MSLTDPGSPAPPQSEARLILTKVHERLRRRPDLEPRYRDAKHVIQAFRKPAFYEVSQRCNLWCEGCFYFESGFAPVVEVESIQTWEAFFAAEAARGVSMAYFVGAEPALEQERLFAASGCFPNAQVGTNGTIRIDPSIPVRIGLSVWAGDDDTDRRLRGAAAFRKAFKLYEGDSRVIILFTLSPWNLDSVRAAVELSRDHGLALTFNLYSPTASYLDKLRGGVDHDAKHYRLGRPGHTPCFSPEDLIRTRRLVDDLIDEFPGTIIYSKVYNQWSTQHGSLYEIDEETGAASRCGSRVTGSLAYFRTDLRPAQPKCCTPDFDCSQCRMYSGGWSTKLRPSEFDVSSDSAFGDWIDMIETIRRIFLYDRPTGRTGAPRNLPLPPIAGRA